VASTFGRTSRASFVASTFRWTSRASFVASTFRWTSRRAPRGVRLQADLRHVAPIALQEMERRW
jgi:hypothetical protein